MSNKVYTQADWDMVTKIKKWIEVQRTQGIEVSRAWLGRKASISNATVSQVINGKYPSSPTAQLQKLMQTIELESARQADGEPGYVKGSVHKVFFTVADRTRKHRTFGVFTGFVGVGKTRTAKEYQLIKPQTLMLECSPSMTPGVMLKKLLMQLGATVPTGLDNKFEEVVGAIAGSNHLLLVDEAENCSAQTLHYLRRIRDMAQIGVVLIGTEKLHALISKQRGQFDQIRSRVAMWPKTIEAITRDDADDMARAQLHELGDVSDEVLDAMWGYCKGSARVLNEVLANAIKDYAPKGQALTAQFVDKVAKNVVSFSRGGL